MSKQTSYKCDVSGSFVNKENAVPVLVKRVAQERFTQSNETILETHKSPSNAEHVSQEVLDSWDLQTEDFERLEIIVVGEDVAGWRDYNPYVSTSVNFASDEERELLRELTYL